MPEQNKFLNSAECRRRPYQPPRLEFYGAVRDLTQTGTGMQSESDDGSMSGMNCTNVYKIHNNCAGVSDRGMKQDIVRIGTHPLGFGLYLFRYKSSLWNELGRGRHFGVMADEVEPVIPAAVSMHPGGYKVVDYSCLGVQHALH